MSPKAGKDKRNATPTTYGTSNHVSECDSVSNNGSCSGESEDPKEKLRKSSISIPGSDNDRREKIRLKNERKHQRQRERRAQELHKRCCGYLMSRKLESLAQLLVAMGFSSDQATLALMLNDGKIEESVAWLFEASEGGEAHTNSTSNVGLMANLKIDVSEELMQISDMEARYNCSKQEVERVIVACEGYLHKAENNLKSQKKESLVTQLKPEESAEINGLMRSQQRQKGEGDDFKYSSVGSSASVFPDPQSKNLLSLHLNHQMAPPVKRWFVTRSSPSMAPSTQVSSPSVKIEVQLSSFGKNKGRMFLQEMDREPVVMVNGKQDPISRVNALSSGLYADNYAAAENVRSNGMFLQNHIRGSVANGNLEQFYQACYKEHPYVFGHVDSSSSGVGFFCKPMHSSSPWPSIRWSTSAPSPSLTVPPSLGLFSDQSAARKFSSHSNVDWNTGGMMPEFDYTRVDWTLDCTSLSSKQGGLRLGISALSRNISGNNRMSSSCMGGLQNVGISRNTSSFSGLREWTSPFEGNDIFSLPRSFVTSPPLMRL